MTVPTYLFVFRIIIFVLLLAIAYVDWRRDVMRERVFEQAKEVLVERHIFGIQR